MNYSEDIYIESFHRYRDMGLDPIHIPYLNGKPLKRPLTKGWPKKAETRQYSPEHFRTPGNLAILLGGPTNVTDIDLDSPRAVKVGQFFLQALETTAGKTMKFGRKSKRESHWIYRASEPMVSVRVKDPVKDESICEIRSLKKDGGRGLCSVFPPSFWCKGENVEEIEFSGDSSDEPILIDADVLRLCFNRIAAVTMLAEHFPGQPNRHDAILSLAGTFARLNVPEEEANVIIPLAYRFSDGYDQTDKTSAEDAVKDTYLKLADKGNEARVYGRPTLDTMIDPRVTTAVLKLMEVNHEDKQPDRLTTVNSIMDTLRSQHLMDLKPPADVFLAEPEIKQGMLHMLSAAPGNGKTTLMFKLCRDIAMNHGKNIFYLTRDDTQGTLRERADSLGGIPKNFHVWGEWVEKDGKAAGPPDVESPALDALAYEQGSDCVIVIETVRTFLKGDENSNSDVAKFLMHMRRWTAYGCTVIFIHHTDKEGRHPYGGAGAFRSAIDIGLEIKASSKPEGRLEVFEVTDFKRKSGDPIKAVYKMRDGVPERTNDNQSEKLLRWLKANPGTTKQTLDKVGPSELGISRKPLRELLNRLIMSGKVKWSSKKLYVAEAAPVKAELCLDQLGEEEQKAEAA